MPVKNQLFQLSIPTTDGQFIARYSAKGLAGLKFPGRVSRRRRGNESQIPLVSKSSVRDAFRLHPISARQARRLLQIPSQILRWHRTTAAGLNRSEERRVGKEGRSRWSPYH